MKRATLVGSLGFLLLIVGLPVARGQQYTITGRMILVDRITPSKIINDNSNVVVWLTPMSDPEGSFREPVAPSSNQSLRVVQKHKHFEPHVVVVRVGAVVDFPNQDPFFHNVFSLFEGKRFDLGLYEAGTTRGVHFDRPGICYIFCNIHPEMSAVVVVVKTPYFAVSNRPGEVTIQNVPPGRFQIQVWCERALPEALKGLNHEITVSENFRSLGTIRLSVASDLRLAHKNKYGRDYDRPTPSSPLYEQP